MDRTKVGTVEQLRLRRRPCGRKPRVSVNLLQRYESQHVAVLVIRQNVRLVAMSDVLWVWYLLLSVVSGHSDATSARRITLLPSGQMT